MATMTSLESIAQQLLEEQWEKSERGVAAQGVVARHACPPVWLLPNLLALVEESHEASVAQRASMIRRLVFEQQFIDENGDGVVDQDELQQAEEVVDILVRVLEQVRQIALEEGQWSDVPVTPQMFG